MKRLLHRFSSKINTVLICLILAAMLFLSVMMAIQTKYAVNAVTQRVAEANQNLVKIYVGQIDRELYTASIQMITIALNDEDYIALKRPSSENAVSMAKAALTSRLNQERLLLNNVDCLFVYEPDSGSFLYSERYDVSRTLHVAIQQQILENYEAGNVSTGCHWFLQKAGNESYLLFLREMNHVIYGAWTCVSQLTRALDVLELGEDGGVIFVDQEGAPLAPAAFLDSADVDLAGGADQSYIRNGFIVMKEASYFSDVSLVAVASVRYLVRDIPKLQLLTAVLALVMVCVMLIVFSVLRKMIVQPLQQLVSAMRKIGGGDLTVRVDPENASAEYHEVFESLNSMVAQSEQLKISVYEEQLGRQRAELQYLQLQVNPHFYVNLLDNICSLAQNQNYAQIEELCVLLSDYFRYKLSKGMEFATLDEEFRHADIYMRIQEMRYPGKFTSELVLPEMLNNIPIPALTVEIFVENTFKYAASLDQPLHIEVKAELTVLDTTPAVAIHILDNGQGFPQEVLDAVKANKPLQTSSGRRIGIQNVLARFHFQYQGAAKVQLYNRETGGAGVKLTLPLMPPEMEVRHV